MKDTQLYRWVKASERLPEGYGKRYFCICQNRITGDTFKSVIYKAQDNFDLNSTVFGVLQWLEQLPSPSVTENKGEDVRKEAHRFYCNKCDDYVSDVFGEKRKIHLLCGASVTNFEGAQKAAVDFDASIKNLLLMAEEGYMAGTLPKKFHTAINETYLLYKPVNNL